MATDSNYTSFKFFEKQVEQAVKVGTIDRQTAKKTIEEARKNYSTGSLDKLKQLAGKK
jgi:hypothetical protein